MLDKIAALIGAMALAGCVGDDPRFPPMGTVDRRMPVAIDYYPHLILHSVPHHRAGRIDPVEKKVGRQRNFGSEPGDAPRPPRSTASPEREPVDKNLQIDRTEHSSLSKGSEAGNLIAGLVGMQASLPADADSFLALVRPRRAKVKAAKTEVVNERVDAADDHLDQASSNGMDLETADSRGVDNRDGSYRLNFEDAEVKDVLQAVLGKVLGLNYTIAPNVTGRITISSSAPQSRSELLSTLETVLGMQGLSLTQSGSTYRIAPTTIGGGVSDTTGKDPGFGISVVPLKYSSVASVNKLLTGFLTDADGVRVDTSRNTVIVRGSGPKRAEIVKAIQALDGDWMHSQAVSMFELKRSRPDEVIPELMRIFENDKDGGSEGIIEFKAIKRLRSIMVISKNERLIRRAGVWIRRLDHQEMSETSGIFVYRPRYRDARELTKIVGGLFGQSDSSNVSGATFGLAGGGQAGIGAGSGAPRSGSSSSSPAGLNAGLGAGNGSQSSNGIGGAGNTGNNSSGSSFGSLNGGGLKGELADPIDANDMKGASGNDKLKLTADTSNNTIVAYTDGETYEKVKATLSQLDIPPLQVAVNVIIAEVQLNDELKYGVQFFLNQSAKSGGSFGFSTSPTSVISSAAQGAAAGVTQALSPAASGFNFISGGAASPNVIISALDSISKVHILSTPSIVVMENKAATLEVGNQVPVTTQQAQSNLTADAPTVNSVTYLDTGIILKIIPRVGQNGVVDMQIDQEISSVVPDATGSTTGSLTPTISKRRIASDISVRSGQNVLLAGLVTDTRSKTNGQVPFIGQQLGNILGNTDNVFSRTELVMFLRPVIVRGGQDATEVTEDFKRGLHDIDLHPTRVSKP